MARLLLGLAVWLAGCSPADEADTSFLDDWQFWTPAENLAPEYWIDKQVRYNNRPTLALAAAGNNRANGCWQYKYRVQPGRHYRFVTRFKPVNIRHLNRSVLAQLTWLDKDSNRLGYVEFPATRAEAKPARWFELRQTYQAPDSAVMARIDLILRWAAGGTVYFGGTEWQTVAQPAPRKVRLAAIHHRPAGIAAPPANLKEFGRFLARAGELKADIVCLPEAVTLVGTDKNFAGVSEPIPGPSTRYLGNLASRYQMYIVAGLVERHHEALYNTAVLIDRHGRLAGKYRKVALPREETDEGLSPGNGFPVFDTDFGRIGLLICWDMHFPEAARLLALQGAEVIFFPNWDSDTILVKARAIENQLYIVSATYTPAMKSGIYDRNGKLIGQATEQSPVAVVEVDLNQRNIWPWVGDFKNRIQRERPYFEYTGYDKYNRP